MSKLKRSLLLCLALVTTIVIQAQSVVKGTVVDETGEPVIGATVMQKGTNKGAVTDLNGNFTLSDVPAKCQIEVSYIGYQTQTLDFSGQPSMTVKLAVEQKSLNEVVVVGYGTQKKVNLTGSVANVDSKLLENRPLTTVSAGLQGLLPGVTVSQGSGQPGSDGGTIRIRGVGTLNNSNPMVIVDGVEGSMDNIDPNDIASVSVLKDAASASIYGSKAANGVILITTKRGKAGKATINYAGNFGWSSAANLPEWCNSAELATLLNQARENDGLSDMFTAEDIQKYADGTDPYGHATCRSASPRRADR